MLIMIIILLFIIMNYYYYHYSFFAARRSRQQTDEQYCHAARQETRQIPVSATQRYVHLICTARRRKKPPEEVPEGTPFPDENPEALLSHRIITT